MLAGVSLFYIYQFDRFNQIIRSIIISDTAILEFTNQLSDALLSETRNDRKYVVLNDEQLYENYLAAQADFNTLLNQAMIEAKLENTKNLLLKINTKHKKLSKLVEEEKMLIRQAAEYSTETYAGEKKKIDREIIELLVTIKKTSEKNVYSKIKELSDFSQKAGSFSIAITIVALIIGLLVAFFITRSITSPLKAIKAKTKQISQGNFEQDIEVQSPPAIRELAVAINEMCHILQEVDDIKSNFFSHMSHELRTPLASIKEGTNMLMEGIGGDFPDKQQRILSIIAKESARLISLVNSLLDLSKMEAGMTEYNFVETDISRLINESLQALMPLAEAKSISIKNNIGSLPPVKVDRERILRVFNNIIGNALKFTGNNGLISLEGSIKQDFLEIAVKDSGIGIPEGDLEKIFLKFRQIIPAKEGKNKGTGLGLAIAKQIILAHGGRMWATSRIGQGSTFYISLPRAA